MKEKTRVIAIVIAIIAGALLIGWLYFRAYPAAWDDFLAELGTTAGDQPAPSAASQTPRKSGDLVASGNIEAEAVVVAFLAVPSIYCRKFAHLFPGISASRGPWSTRSGLRIHCKPRGTSRWPRQVPSRF